MNNTIVVIKGVSQYNVLRYQTDIMVEEWKNLGYEVHVWDLSEINKNKDNEKWVAMLDDIQTEHFFTFSMQALLFDLAVDGYYLMQFISTPYIGWIVDHPMYHYERIKAAGKSNNAVICCIDEGHVDFIKKYVPEAKLTLYLPHGGFKAKKEYNYGEKNIDVFAPGGYKDARSIKDEIEHLPAEKKLIIEKAIQYILEHGNASSVDGLEYALNELQIEKNDSNYIVELDRIETYIREYCRETCVRLLVDAGIKVTVAGRGWENFTCNHPENLQIIGENGMDITETVESIAKSKICLNLIPIYTKGFHERIFTAMLNHSVCVTPFNDYLYNTFSEWENITFFDLANMEEIIEVIKELQSHKALTQTIAENAYQYINQEASFTTRAQTILQIARSLTRK